MCCRALWLPVGMDEITKMAGFQLMLLNRRGMEGHRSDTDDVLFAYYNFVPIPRDEAYSINPYLRKWWIDDRDGSFYRCRLLKNGKCSVYPSRPNLCSGFPYYSGKLDPKTMCYYSRSCGYRPIWNRGPLRRIARAIERYNIWKRDRILNRVLVRALCKETRLAVRGDC